MSEIKAKTVIAQKRDNIWKVILNRPEVLNAINDELIRDLKRVLEAIYERGEPGVIILTGAGRAFCSGIDISFAAKMSSISSEQLRVFIKNAQEAFNLLELIEMPTIAAIHGYALGGGLELALACDIRIAAEGTKMGLPEVRFGLVPDLGGAQRLPRIVGLGKAKELVFTGKIIDAREAERIGLVNMVVSEEKLMEAAEGMAREFLKGSLKAIGLAKRILNRAFDLSMESLLDYTAYIQNVCILAEDQIKYVMKFLEEQKKRKAKQSG
ncbi:MAG: enoyl-CoA hydratase/isomerase family protein [Candidatus Baldrarchaeia archaeon]